MRDERFRRLQRRAPGESESGAAALIKARLRTGELSYEQVELAAYLGSAAARGAVDFRADEEADLEEFLWGLCEWGPWIQERACVAAIQAVSAAWPEVAEIRSALSLFESRLAGVQWGHDEGLAALDALHQLEERNTGPTACAELGSAIQGTLELLLALALQRPEDTQLAVTAIRVLRSADRALMQANLVETLEALAPSLLLEPISDLKRVDYRALIRVQDYERDKEAAEEDLRHLRNRGWEYLPAQPLANDVNETARRGVNPRDCLAVRAAWNLGDDVVHLMVFVVHRSEPRRRTGFAFKYADCRNLDDWYKRLEVRTWIAGSFVDQAWFEAAMLAWHSLRTTVRVRRHEQVVGDRGLKIYLDDERTPPPGWLLVRWPEEVIALLMTCQVGALSLDHDLGDLDDERTGYTVLQWLEEQVATCEFEPPEEIAVHSANASAAIKMRSAIESIRRLHARNRDG